MHRSARAIWQGTVAEGNGSITTNSGVLDNTPYSLSSRVEDGSGTSPEELLAAAHAGCFNMSLAHVLNEAGYTPERLETHARLTFELSEKALRIQRVSIDLDARIPGIERTTFLELAGLASKTCTVSAVLNTEIKVNFRLLN